MAHIRTRLLIVAATIASGILAGTVVDRVAVGGPAWHAVGVPAWVQYSRHADLGAGLVVYPLEAIGATLLMIAAAVNNHLDRDRCRAAAVPLIAGVAFSVIGLLLTIKAAPIMLALDKPLAADAEQRAFTEFFFWGLYLRGVADLLAFLAAVWALCTLSD
jgi:hypothetical protein